MSNKEKNKVKLFTLNSNRELALEIAEKLGYELGKVHVDRFSDGEIQIHIEETVRDSDVFIIQSTSGPVNENTMELLIMIDALKRASASQINVVIPYFGYARQDRLARPREPITAKLMANLLQKAGATRVLSIDLHTDQMQGFFDIPMEHLTGIPVLSQYIENKGLENIVVVSAHLGSVRRARKLADILDVPLALVDEREPEECGTETRSVIGDVEGKNVILIDDLIDTGTTMLTAAQAIAESGAKSIYACCTHPVLTGNVIEKIERSPITELVVTNTIQLPQEKQLQKIVTISVAPLLADAIDRIHFEKAVSPLFE
ncbi:ribose-phosphate diphosphokinase [Bacillus tuaregi]|uniref:ribose-phosphate diphosphokinase n=1 Tax=Bacillus tuaregi TaxID=1816695 RepID=UPI000AE8F295|nr:ribose-phosphate pyrophosphokinase [Bacillus tuaregi]